MLKSTRIVPAVLTSLLLTGTATAQQSNAVKKLGASEPFNQVVGSPNPDFLELLADFFIEHFALPVEYLLEVTITGLTATPDVYPNPAVEEIHRQLLLLVVILSTLVFMTAGLLYMIGPILGISYSQVRLILPRVIIGLIFATISLPLLQLTVDFTNALIHALKPSLLGQSLEQSIGLTVGIILAYFLESVLLLAVAAIMIIRMIYIMFVAAISPLLALMWSLPRIRRYADTFIAGYFAALMIAPLDLLVLKFSLALMDGRGANMMYSSIITTEQVSNWLFGIVSLILLILVPYQVWGASQTIVGQARRVTSGVKNRRQNNNENEDDLGLTDEQKQRLKENQRKRLASIKAKGGKK